MLLCPCPRPRLPPNPRPGTLTRVLRPASTPPAHRAHAPHTHITRGAAPLRALTSVCSAAPGVHRANVRPRSKRKWPGAPAHTLSPAPAVPHPLQRGPPPIPRSNRKRPRLPCTHIPSPRSLVPQGLRRRARGAKMCTRSGAMAAGCDASSCARVCTRGAARASCCLVHAH
jgi:hypothetical protein